jgi:hypothetical protein
MAWPMRLTRMVTMCVMLGAAREALPDAFDFESLRALVAQQRAGGVEAVVAALPEELRSQYTLVFASRSLQGASWRDPRVVLFGRTARLVVTFNGEPSQRGYSALETMEFNPVGNRFVFREISFTAGPSGFDVRISDPNPARCTACHGEPARPIWDSAPLWPGGYGERYGAGLSAAELQGIRTFLAAQAGHPRYRHLLDAASLADRATFVANSRTRYDGGAVEPPNARFSALLATHNVQAILAQLAAQPAFAAHLALLVGASDGGCGALETFYPDQVGATVAAAYGRFAAAARAAEQRQAAAKASRHEGRGNPQSGMVAEFDPTPLRFVVERDLGVPTQRWTLAFERGSYDLAAPAGTITLAAALRAWLARSDAALVDAAAYRTFDAADRYCTHLRRESRDALTAWYGSHPPPHAAPPAAQAAGSPGPARQPRLLGQCAACHGGDVAPHIPFADPAALAPLLVGGVYPRGRLLDEILFRLAPEAGVDRMPRGMNPAADEREALERYFIALAAGARTD